MCWVEMDAGCGRIAEEAAGRRGGCPKEMGKLGDWEERCSVDVEVRRDP